jgi:chromate transporter
MTHRLRELALLFVMLGVIGFGGPAAHIALMRREVVERRRWLDDRQFVDLIGITNLIPGPNSTEMAMHVGRLRAGVPGLIVAGLAFIVPAATIVGVLAWLYVSYGQTTIGSGVLYGVKPVILVIIAAAIWSLARVALRGVLLPAVAVGVVAAALLGVNQVALLAVGAAGVAAARSAPTGARPGRFGHGIVAVPLATAVGGGIAAAGAIGEVNLAVLALTFLKIGSVLYGSGYALVAFLREDFVQGLGWLTDAQLLDAVAIGQATPGPLFTTATFIGYVLAGIPGAVLATAAIFLPGFALVALLSRFLERARDRPLTAALLDGVTAAALGLMAAVSIQLAGDAVVDPFTIVILAGAAVGLLLLRLPSIVLVAAGAAAGLLAQGPAALAI